MHGGEDGIFHDGNVRRVIHAFQPRRAVQSLREPQNLPVPFGRCAHDHLRRLPRGQKIALALFGAEEIALPLELFHGQQQAFLALLRGEEFQARLGGEFHVITHAVGIARRLRHERFVRLGNALQMYVALKRVLGAQKFYGADELFHGVVGRFLHRRGEEEPLDIVALIKIDGKFADLFGGGGGARIVAAPSAHAVFAVEHAVVAH